MWFFSASVLLTSAPGSLLTLNSTGALFADVVATRVMHLALHVFRPDPRSMQLNSRRVASLAGFELVEARLAVAQTPAGEATTALLWLRAADCEMQGRVRGFEGREREDLLAKARRTLSCSLGWQRSVFPVMSVFRYTQLA